MLLAAALLIAILLGGVVGTLVLQDAGYVLIKYSDTIVETSLWIAILGLVILYFLMRLVAFAIRKLTQGQLKMVRWQSGRRARSVRDTTERGMLVLAEQRWSDARKLLIDSAKRAEIPTINYLGAAEAAQRMQDKPARDEFLRSAEKATPSARFAVMLTQAHYYMEDKRYDQALDTLQELHKRAPRHAAVLAQLAACREAREDWADLAELVPALRKYQAVTSDEVERLERLAWDHLLVASADPAAQWKALPAALRRDPELMQAWVERLLAADQDDAAEHAARLALGECFAPSLVAAYGNIMTTDPRRHLAALQKLQQKWQKHGGDDPSVYLALGRLSLQCGDFPRARELFEASLKQSPDPIVYGELGRLCVALGDERRGTDYLLHAVGDLPDLPQPKAPVIRKVGP